MGNFHRVIGIDLGTTFSAVAAWNYDRQETKIIPNRQGDPTTPSVVYISPSGEVSVGKAAKEKLLHRPEGVIFEAKRKMGEKEPDGSKRMAQARGQQYDPELISAYILKELKICAEKIIGEPIHDVVITVPAYFKESQKNATREAARIAKLNPRLIINEPTAAAVAYGLESGEAQTFVVYDFGGGTFDVSVVRVSDEKTVEVLGTGGDSNLGGGDIDQAIMRWALGKMKAQFGKDFTGDKKVEGKLRLKAEQVKINLCNENASQEFLLESPAPGIEEINYTLTTAEFDSMIAPLLERTFRQVQTAMDSAFKKHELTWEDVEAIILVGGSSKIPGVGKLLMDRFHKPLKNDLNPDEIVALGAAKMAMNYAPSLAAEIKDDVPLAIDKKVLESNQIHNTNVKDVVSHSLGVGLMDDVFDIIIGKDSVIPAKNARDKYTTAEDNQTSICVPVYQGENGKASLNFKLGEVIIADLKPEPKGKHTFEIAFALDSDGIFFAQVKHLQTGTVKDIKLDRGKASMTEKKRIDLSEVVEAGSVGMASNSPGPARQGGSERDGMEQLIHKANSIKDALPIDKRLELERTLEQLAEAKQAGNSAALSQAVVTLTMMLINQNVGQSA